MTDSERLARMETILDAVDRRTQFIERQISGSNGDPGIRVRLDRLEQAEEREVWLHRAMVVSFLGVVGLIAARVLDWLGFTGGK